MQITRLDTMRGGWFVGDFTPSLLVTPHAEVAVQHFCAGDRSPAHTHRIALEITVIISGVAVMNGVTLVAGDIVTLQPGDVAEFSATEDTTTVVVKSPSVAGDKYLVDAVPRNTKEE